MLRRTFISRIASLLFVLPAVVAGCLSSCSRKISGTWIAPDVDSGTLKTLEAVQVHLLPAGAGRPGAADMNSLQYLMEVLHRSDNDPEDLKLIMSGMEDLERLSVELMQHSFVTLNYDQKEQVLRRFEQKDMGYRCLYRTLSITLEGLLADPLYGSNIEGAGWRWLDHNPGLPRPVRNKLYYNL